MKNWIALIALLLIIVCHHAFAGDWNQWRGSARDGVSADSPPLLESLPEEGIKPIWLSDEEIPAANSGGWSSPVVANGKVYVFTHQRVRFGEDELPPQKYPWLPPEKRTGMTDEEYEEYERNRRDEDEQRSRYFRFDEIIYCLDAVTGKTLWKNTRKSVYTRFLQSSTPAVADGRLYVLGAALTARCVNAENGEDVWHTQLPGEFRDEYMQSSFVVADGVAAVFARQLFGLDANSGKLLWQTQEEEDRNLHTSPVAWTSDDRTAVICNVNGDDTACFDARTGDELWRVESLAGNSTPIVSDDLLITYGSSRKGGLRCYKISAGGAEHLWTYHGVADSGSSPVVVDGQVFAQGERRLACVDLATGDEQWMTMLKLDRPRYTSLIAADGKVVYAFDGLLCFAANRAEYQPLFEAKIDRDSLLAEESVFRRVLDIDKLEKTAEGQKEAERLWRQRFNNSGPLPCTTPAISNGRLFVRFKDRIACYDLRNAGQDVAKQPAQR